MDPMLAQLMAMMNEDTNKENKASNQEEQKQGDSNPSNTADQTSKRKEIEAELAVEAKKKPRLLTRSGSDP